MDDKFKLKAAIISVFILLTAIYLFCADFLMEYYYTEIDGLNDGRSAIELEKTD